MQWNQEYDDVDKDDAVDNEEGGSTSRFGTSIEPTNIKTGVNNQFVTGLPKGRKNEIQLHESQYDSKASDYFLLLNHKN